MEKNPYSVENVKVESVTDWINRMIRFGKLDTSQQLYILQSNIWEVRGHMTPLCDDILTWCHHPVSSPCRLVAVRGMLSESVLHLFLQSELSMAEIKEALLLRLDTNDLIMQKAQTVGTTDQD